MFVAVFFDNLSLAAMILRSAAAPFCLVVPDHAGPALHLREAHFLGTLELDVCMYAAKTDDNFHMCILYRYIFYLYK